MYQEISSEGVCKVSKSFMVDLSGYGVYLPIGSGKKTLQRKMGALDLSSILMDFGYKLNATYVPIVGVDISDLRGGIAEQVMGVPTSANVEIKCMGMMADKVLVTLSY